MSSSLLLRSPERDRNGLTAELQPRRDHTADGLRGSSNEIILIVSVSARLICGRFRVADPRKAFGKRVRELRRAAGLSQEQLAARADLHWTYVGGIERGERNPALINITRLARALGVPTRDLLPVEK